MTNEGDRSRILDMDFWATAGGTETWNELHRREVSEEQERELRKCTYSGRPFGEEAFVAEMEDRFQRRWRRSGGKEAARFAISA